ncbi:hypothetical protein NPIL_606771, partial [Nephila pilipes]
MLFLRATELGPDDGLGKTLPQ